MGSTTRRVGLGLRCDVGTAFFGLSHDGYRNNHRSGRGSRYASASRLSRLNPRSAVPSSTRSERTIMSSKKSESTELAPRKEHAAPAGRFDYGDDAGAGAENI